MTRRVRVFVTKEAGPVLDAPGEATHVHYKGGICRLLNVVVYRGADGRLWLRPKANFHGVLPTGERRFKPIR